MKNIFFAFIVLSSTVSFCQSDDLVDVSWLCTSIVINGNTFLPPNDDEVPYVILQMLQDNDLGTQDFESNVCDAISAESVSYNNANGTFTLSQLIQTLGGCPLHQNFQGNYFGFFYNNEEIPIAYAINNTSTTRTLTLTAQNGDVANYEEFTLGLREHQLEEIKIFPNPTTDIITITSANDRIAKIEIFSITGQIIKSEHNPNSKIDVSDIAKGIYFLKIYSDEKVITKQFIKN